MATNPLLDALLRNESGGRNIANTHEGTTSGQAQGHFQITTGTWKDFGGTKYAPTPLGATYEQQAEIASKIPLKRWDSSTINAMRATGLPVDPSRTLGENLGGNFNSGKYALNVAAGGVPGTGITSMPRGMPQAPPLPPPTTIADHPIAGILGTNVTDHPAAADVAPTPAAPAGGFDLMGAITKLTAPTGTDNKGASPLGAIASALSPQTQRQPDNIIQTGNLQSSDALQQTQMSQAQQLMQTLIAKRKRPQQVPGFGLGGMMG